ncbi:hypothetical protein SDC9_183216 [bioreactor metagenome]|uniref:Uncharacterized protein n=1 Tax=bioreactor metagenome TaxID=1076179 RepID=A0A645H9Q2_9ZZZZ
MQAAFALVFALGGVHVVEIVGQAVLHAVLVQLLGRPVQQRRHFDQAIGVDADGLHLRAHGAVGGAQRREPHLRRGFAQRPGKGFELDFLRESGVARVIQRRGGAVHRLAVRA